MLYEANMFSIILSGVSALCSWLELISSWWRFLERDYAPGGLAFLVKAILVLPVQCKRLHSDYNLVEFA